MEIIVKGRSGSGKSAVAQHIAEVLAGLGFAVIHEPEYKRTQEEQEHVLSHIAKARATPITVVEEQAARSGH